MPLIKYSRAEFFAKIAGIGAMHPMCRNPKILAEAAMFDFLPIQLIAMTGDQIMEALVAASSQVQNAPYVVVAFEWAWEHYQGLDAFENLLVPGEATMIAPGTGWRFAVVEHKDDWRYPLAVRLFRLPDGYQTHKTLGPGTHTIFNGDMVTFETPPSFRLLISELRVREIVIDIAAAQ